MNEQLRTETVTMNRSLSVLQKIHGRIHSLMFRRCRRSILRPEVPL